LPSGEKLGAYSRDGSPAPSAVSRRGEPAGRPLASSCSHTRPKASKAIHLPSGDWLVQRRMRARTGPPSTFSCHATRGASHCFTFTVNGISAVWPRARSRRRSLPWLEKTMAAPSGVKA